MSVEVLVGLAAVIGSVVGAFSGYLAWRTRLNDMKGDLSEVKRKLDGMATRSDISDLKAEIKGLTARIDGLVDQGSRPTVENLVTELRDEVRRVLDAVTKRPGKGAGAQS